MLAFTLETIHTLRIYVDQLGYPCFTCLDDSTASSDQGGRGPCTEEPALVEETVPAEEPSLLDGDPSEVVDRFRGS